MKSKKQKEFSWEDIRHGEQIRQLFCSQEETELYAPEKEIFHRHLSRQERQMLWSCSLLRYMRLVLDTAQTYGVGEELRKNAYEGLDKMEVFFKASEVEKALFAYFYFYGEDGRRAFTEGYLRRELHIPLTEQLEYYLEDMKTARVLEKMALPGGVSYFMPKRVSAAVAFLDMGAFLKILPECASLTEAEQVDLFWMTVWGKVEIK